MALLTPVVSSAPPNFGIGASNSYVQVDGAGRTLYAEAIYVVNASDISGGGGGGNYVPYTGANSSVDLGTNNLSAQSLTLYSATSGSVLFAGASGTVLQDNNGLFFDNINNQLGVGTNSFLSSGNVINAYGSNTATIQINTQNALSGNSSSSDLIATADTGTNITNYIDVGINSSTYNDTGYTVGGVLGGYVYNLGGDLSVGTGTSSKVLNLHTGGTLLSNIRATISDTGLTVNGVISSNSIVTAFGGNSNGWNIAYTTLTSNRASWIGGNSAFVTVSALSANWNNTQTTLNTNSASWIGGNSAFTYVNANSATDNYTYNSANFVKLSSEPFTLLNDITSINPINGSNTVTGKYSVISGGIYNNISCSFSNIAGGCCNTASGCYSQVGGGKKNTASGNYSTVNGAYNTATKFGSNIAGGYGNIVTGCYSIIAGGKCNTASGNYSTTSGGCRNTASGNYTNITGGNLNIASGQSSFIASGSGNDTKGYANTFILGSLLSASQINYTYVNNLSSQGLVYDANGVSSDWNNTQTTVNTNSASWIGGNIAYTTLTSNSASWIGGKSAFVTVSALSANWNAAYTTLTSNSASTWFSPYTFNSSTSSINPISGANITTGIYSFIAAGSANDTKGFRNTFILGSNLSSAQVNYTYVNNISSQGVGSFNQLNIGNAVVASSGVSGIANKIQVFNSSGVSLGYIPIYTTIA